MYRCSQYLLCLVLTLGALFVCHPAIMAQRQFGFDNRKPSGQPYLKPEVTVQKFRVGPGYEVKLFAGEPDVINPIAFTIDEKGRVWVLENFEYPRRTPPGKKPRDRIKILEDTNGDGKADKVTLWASGQSLPTGWQLASGIEVGHGGVYLGAAPYIFHLRDTDGDGKCDKQETLLKGFGSHDTHETLNTFQWGPDCKLYGLHGVFTHSVVDGVKLNAAVWRYDGRGKKFEVFAEGTSNPWGMDFDSHGQCHLACCVIPHLFHMVPGGRYRRQAGSSFHPYAYGLLQESCDHTHHRESGWAHAGLLVLDGDHVPKSYRGSVIMGSIHGCSIKRDVLRSAGSTYLAGHAADFLVSGDKNFRPINLRWGPDGSIYVIDWHDQNPCHQAHPDSWDKKRGRIYRIVRKSAGAGKRGQAPLMHSTRRAVPVNGACPLFPAPGRSPRVDLSKYSSQQLVATLKKDNPWWYRTALRLLHERRDKSVAPALEKMVFTDANEIHALRGLWGLFAVDAFDDALAIKLLAHKNQWLRYWAVRFLGEDGKVSTKMLDRLTTLAKDDASAVVRLQLASTAQRLQGQNVLPMLHNLMSHKTDVKDRFLPLMLWLAYEPRVSAKANPALDWLQKHAAGNPLVTNEIVPRTLRRLVATGKASDLAACVNFLAGVSDSAVRREALRGMTLALRNRQVKPPASWRFVFPALLKDPDQQVRQSARKLAVNFRDQQAIRVALKIAQDKTRAAAARIDAIEDLALAQPKAATAALLEIVQDGRDKTDVRAAACRALGVFDNAQIPKAVLTTWKKLPLPLRNEAVNILSGRKSWAKQLLTAVEKKQIRAADLNNNHILRMRAFKDKTLNSHIEKVWGQYRKTPAELTALITKMRVALDHGGGSFERGRKVFEANCAKCHSFAGKGSDVGPNLDGAGRDIEYLLANILDPNRVVGQPYFTRLVVLKNGRVETGLLASEDPRSITLKGENNALKTILRQDIEGKIITQTKSVMPEGLTKGMTTQDFRDLTRYLMAHPFVIHVKMTTPIIPRQSLTFDAEKILTSKDLKWKQADVGISGKIRLPKAGREMVSFLTTAVTTPKTMNTRLQLGATHPLRVWLNGKLVYQGRPGGNQVRPDQVSVPVTLRAGKNIVVMEVTYQGKNALVHGRFLDPYRQVRYHP